MTSQRSIYLFEMFSSSRTHTVSAENGDHHLAENVVIILVLLRSSGITVSISMFKYTIW